MLEGFSVLTNNWFNKIAFFVCEYEKKLRAQIKIIFDFSYFTIVNLLLHIQN